MESKVMASQIVYVPKACKEDEGKPARLSGSVTLRKPTFDEKYSYLSESGLSLDAEGKPVEISETKARIDFIRKVVGISRKHYIKVELVVIESGEKIESLDDLESHGDFDDVLIEIGTQVFNGFRLGNG
jgi:hypothetical protein